MNAFTFIISTYFPEIDIFKTAFEFPPDRNSPINKDFLAYSFLNTLHFGNLKYEDDNKFTILKVSILDNIFIKDEDIEFYLNTFNLSQRCYHGFCLFARIIKLKKAKIYDVDTDLYRNKLCLLSPNIITKIYDDNNRTIYNFRISDLISIINNSLSNSSEFFAEPLKIKNPYTNLPFTVAQLYTVYFVLNNLRILCLIYFIYFFK